MLPLESFKTKPCPGAFQVDSTYPKTATVLRIQVTDTRGCPVDFSPSSGGGGDGSSSSSSSSLSSSSSSPGPIPPVPPWPPGWTAKYLVREMYWKDPLFSFTATPTVPSEGRFDVSIGSTIIKKPGMYLGALEVYNATGALELCEFRYLQVYPRLTDKNNGPITIPEVRMALWDHCPEQNTLLDDYEFSDQQIAFCIRRIIDRWNETPPDLGPISIVNFPYREHWIIGTVGYLLQTAAQLYYRNKLTYNAAGVSVADKDKGPEYIALSKERLMEYDMWMRNKKMELNIAGGYGTFGSGYGRRY